VRRLVRKKANICKRINLVLPALLLLVSLYILWNKHVTHTSSISTSFIMAGHYDIIEKRGRKMPKNAQYLHQRYVFPQYIFFLCKKVGINTDFVNSIYTMQVSSLPSNQDNYSTEYNKQLAYPTVQTSSPQSESGTYSSATLSKQSTLSYARTGDTSTKGTTIHERERRAAKNKKGTSSLSSPMLYRYLGEKTRLEYLFVDLAYDYDHTTHLATDSDDSDSDTSSQQEHELETFFNSCGGGMVDWKGHPIAEECRCLVPSWGVTNKGMPGYDGTD